MSFPTRYTRSGEHHIAWQAEGREDAIDLIYVPTWVGQLEVLGEEPTIQAFVEKMCGFARLISFDRRGAGLSDPMVGAPTLEDQIDDVLAVMEACLLYTSPSPRDRS